MPSTICAEPLETDGQTWNTSIISGKGGWRNGSGVNGTCCFCRGSRFVPSTHVVAHNYLELQAQEIWQPPSGFYRHLLVVHIHTCRETIIHIKLKKWICLFGKRGKRVFVVHKTYLSCILNTFWPFSGKAVQFVHGDCTFSCIIDIKH